MATLVLSTAGRVVGGPVGGAIGAFVGQQIDQRLFAPKPRRGPQLGDLAVQTSHYGSDIPKLFGRMRVAGTVIWATDLRERRSTSGGGKGQAKSVAYSYSASFAVLLSARPILDVRRIWADGKLLRGEAGDFKSATGYRLHDGSEAQTIDPLIASIEGAEATPAYRGLAYAVFEDFELADYGNRIPSLSFEIEADPGPVAAAAIAEILSDGLLRAGPSPTLAGYAATGESLRAAIEELAATAGLSLAEREEGLLLGSPAAAAAATLIRDEAGAGPAGPMPRLETSRKSSASVPLQVTLSYQDPERDFQTGLQRASRGTSASRVERLALPASLTAADAKAMAARRLQRLWMGRETMKLRLPWRRAALRPGEVVLVEGREGWWKIAETSLERMAVTLELERLAPAPALAGADSGRAIGGADRPHGPTRLIVLDTPLTSDRLPARAQIAVLAAGSEAGWRRADLSASWDGGATWQAAGATAPAATLGTALLVPGPGGSATLDLRGSLVVELLTDEMWIESRSDAALGVGENLAVLGEELIQFGEAAPLGGRRFRLSRLLRGRRGTEWAAAGHAPGEDFALIDAETMILIEPPPAAIGSDARLLATGLGDAGTVPVARAISGEALRPPAPVHLEAVRRPNGDVAIGWVRRSRSGWLWASGADTPLGEEREAYRLTLAAGPALRAVEIANAFYIYTAEDQLADGASGPISISAVQLGTAAPSRPATLILE